MHTLIWIIPAFSLKLDSMDFTQDWQVMPSMPITVVWCIEGKEASNPISSIAVRIFSASILLGLYVTLAFFFSKLTWKIAND